MHGVDAVGVLRSPAAQRWKSGPSRSCSAKRLSRPLFYVVYSVRGQYIYVTVHTCIYMYIKCSHVNRKVLLKREGEYPVESHFSKNLPASAGISYKGRMFSRNCYKPSETLWHNMSYLHENMLHVQMYYTVQPLTKSRTPP